MFVGIGEDPAFEEIKSQFFALDLTSTYTAFDKRDKVEEFVLEDKLEFVKKNVKDLQYVLNLMDKCSNNMVESLLEVTKKRFSDAAAKLPSIHMGKRALPRIKQYVIPACKKNHKRHKQNKKIHGGTKKPKLLKDDNKKHVKLKRGCKNKVNVAKLVGNYQKAFNLMLETHKNHKRTLKGNVMSVNCADAACHTMIKDAECNIINFSAQTWGDSIKQHFTTLISLNIIMFLEINMDEQLECIKDKFVDIYDNIKKIIEKKIKENGDPKFYF